MLHFNEYMMQTRREELLKEAENYRLISLVQRRSTRWNYLRHRLINWVGGRLCRWGSMIQDSTVDFENNSPTKVVNNYT